MYNVCDGAILVKKTSKVTAIEKENTIVSFKVICCQHQYAAKIMNICDLLLNIIAPSHTLASRGEWCSGTDYPMTNLKY